MEGNCWSIKVYARIKPFDSSKGAELVEYDIYDRVSVDDISDCIKSKIVINHKPSGETINNKVEQQTFRFCKVFDQDTQQGEIYEIVAKPVVDRGLEGYNGTVFAYGQTGSGKTYSISGGPGKYEDRGIIPRSIQQIFSSIQQMPADVRSSVFISYCEIYNETGYDLLDAAPKARKRLEDLPRVTVSEDLHGNFNFRNLSLKKVETEEEALNLLFLGDSNRVTSETSTNKMSSRSHCVFTIVLATRSDTSGIVRRAKLNLVDLAGSERVSKTGVNGKNLEEAKNINLSLHFLEQVIVALNNPECKHVPYRNSMMTIILKDSLGGNCLTTMLGTLSAELENIWETISTCRFAQRVALIKNEVSVNEELDPLMEVKILKEEIKALRKQLALAGAQSVDVELTPDEIDECHYLVQEILAKEDIESLPRIPADLRKINQCTWLLKCAATDAEKMRNTNSFGLLPSRQGSAAASTEAYIEPYLQTSSRPSSRSFSSRYVRPSGESMHSAGRARDSQQPDDNRDITGRVESSTRRLASLRSLLDHTRTANNSADENMNEFIANMIHQIHDDEKEYRLLLGLHHDTQEAEDLLIEEIEISKLKMLFDFRNLYQEHAIYRDSRSGGTHNNQLPADHRETTTVDPLSARNYPNQSERCLETMEGVSSTLENVTDSESVHTQVKSMMSRESTPSIATRRSIANKTDVSLDNVSFGPDAVSRSRIGSGKTVPSPRGPHLVSAVSDSRNPMENLSNSPNEVSPDELSPEGKNSAVSTAARRTRRVSINGPQPTSPRADNARFKINGSSISTGIRRTSVSFPAEKLEGLTSSLQSEARLPQTEHAASPTRRGSVASTELVNSTVQDIASMSAEAGFHRDASVTSVAKQVFPVSQKPSGSNASLKPIVPSEASLDNTYGAYPNQSSTLTCSDTTRRSFLPQMGMRNFSAKSTSLSCALAADNVIDQRPVTSGPSSRTLDSQVVPRNASNVSNSLLTDTPEGVDSLHPNDLRSLRRVSTATRSAVGPQSRTSTISTTTRAQPSSISAVISDNPADSHPLANFSTVSTGTRGSIVPQAGASTVSMKSIPPQSNFSVDAISRADAGLSANVPTVSNGTRGSIVPQAGASTVSMQSIQPQSNLSVDAISRADAGPLRNASALSTGTRGSIVPQAGASTVSMKSIPPQSNFSVDAISRADAGLSANVSTVSTGTRGSIVPQAGASTVSMKSIQPQSNLSVDAISRADAGLSANVSTVSTGTRGSIVPQAGASTVSMKSIPPQSNLSVDAISRADAGLSANVSAVSTGTRGSIVPQAGASTVSMKSIQPQSNLSVDAISRADAGPLRNASALSTGTTRSVPQPKKMPERKGSAVSLATTLSLDPAMTGTANVSTANGETATGVPPTSSLIVEYLAPHDALKSLPNSNFNMATVDRSYSFAQPQTADPSETSYRETAPKSRCASANDPVLSVGSASGECDLVEAPKATSDLSAEIRSDNQDNNSLGSSGLIPLESLHFPSGAVSSVQRTAFSAARRQVTTPTSTSQRGVRPNTAQGSAVSAVSGRLTDGGSMTSTTTSANAECSVSRDINPSRNSAGTSSPVNKYGVSPREARRSRRNSTPLDVSPCGESERSPAAVLQSAMTCCSTSATTPKSVSQQHANFGPLDGNEIQGPSTRTPHKGRVEISECPSTFKPREAVQQSGAATKGLPMTATQAEFDAFYGTDRTESYTCTITIPSTTAVTQDIMVCSDVIPCSSTEFAASTVDCIGNRPTQAELDAFYGTDRTESYTCTITIPSTTAVQDSMACMDVTPCLSSGFAASTVDCIGNRPTQAEFDAFYGTNRTESYACTITIPSTTAVQDSMACMDVTPCSSSGFAPSTVDCIGNMPPACSEACVIGGSQQNFASTPEAVLVLQDCSEPVSFFTINDLCLTGDPEIDEEIIAFYKARNCLE